jgi:HK97 family phage prohead protease
VRSDKDGLRGNIVFNAKEFDPFGWSIGERVKAGVLRAGSVGFRVLEVEFPDKKSDTAVIFRRQELLEFSICNVPANPFALNQLAVSNERLAMKDDAAVGGRAAGGFSSLGWLGWK